MVKPNLNLCKNILYIFLGVFFEKTLPLLIALFFISYISDAEYGLWIIYFQIILIFSSTIISPLQTFFNRNFYTTSDKKLVIYNSNLIASALILFALIFHLISDAFPLDIFLSLISVITLILNNLLFNYFRFDGKNLKYFVISFFRIFSLVAILCGFISVNGEIELSSLLIALIVSNSIVILLMRHVIVFQPQKYKLKEFSMLCLYGTLTLSLGAVEKLVLLYTNLDILDMATLGYALVFAGSPSVVVEAFKKYFSPIYFKNFNELGFYSSSIIRKTIHVNIFLVFFQILFPLGLFSLLDRLQFTKNSLIGADFIPLLLLLSISLAIHSLYHFINPYIFFISKSGYLSLIILITGLIFTCLVFSFGPTSLLKLSIFKITANMILVTFTWICAKNLKINNHV